MHIFSTFIVSFSLLSTSVLSISVPNQQTITKHSDLSKVISASPLLSLHRDLVEIESISSNELAVGKWLVSKLEAYNFTVTTQQVDDAVNKSIKRWNLYATPNLSKYPFSETSPKKHGKSNPKVMLSSHIDTVPPFIPYSLSQPNHSTKRSDILISGRGTVDDKACVAAQTIATLELLSDSDSPINPSDIALLFVVGEETRGDGMTHFSNSKLYTSGLKSSLKGTVFGEPTDGILASGHKGISMAHIKATGKAAHSGYPWLGKSANSMILPALMVLDKLGDLLPSEGGLPRSEHFGNSTVNVGYMMGGIAANVVPAHAEAKVSFRLAGGTAESVKKIILNAISGADPNGELDVDIYQGYGPVKLDVDVPGFDSQVVNYGTDVINLEVAEGVKRYLYGPGSIQVAHGDNEALTVGEMEQAVVDYKKLVRHVLSL